MTRLLPRAPFKPLADQIRAFVESCDPLDRKIQAQPEVRRLVREVFQLQMQHDPGYRQLCQARGIRVEDDPPWYQIPKVPTAVFKSLDRNPIGRSEDETEQGLVFRSSGTTSGATRSLHINPFPELYRSIIDAGYSAYCLAGFSEPPPTLSLIPSRSQVADSSLGFMAEHILHRHAAQDSVVAFGPAGVDLDAAVAFVEHRQSDQRKAMVLTTAFALVELLDHLAEKPKSGAAPLLLPPGSVVFETGGFKGRTRELSRSDLVAETTRILGVTPESIVREYGMTELTSQMYSASLLGGDPELLVAPPWIRAGVFDPATLEPSSDGEQGLIGFFDLGNVGSYPAVLTEDLGRMHDQGLELLGRASQAELRGCSLTVEELQIAAGRLPRGTSPGG